MPPEAALETPAAAAPAAATPAAPAAPAAPSAPATPSAPSGIKEAMAAFEADTTPAPKAGDKTATPPAKPAEGKPAAPAKPAEDVWAKAPKHLQNEFYKTKRTSEEAIGKLESKIRELENKPQPTPVDDKRLQQYEQQLKSAEERLAEIDYRQSSEFKAKFVKRWADTHTIALNEVKQMQVTTGKDDEGNAVTRPATEQDFEKIRRLPLAEQAKAVTDMFGPYASHVVSRLFQLQEIQQSADQAVAEHAGKAEQTAKERQAAQERESQTYQQQVEASAKELAEKWPQHFAPPADDAEIAGSYQKSKDFVEGIVKQASKLPPSERAAFNAVLMARAIAFQPKTLLANRLAAENQALKTELSKYRKSDPGAQVEPSGAALPTGDDEIPQGIGAAAKKAAEGVLT